jgi:CheY-like chemotaxis protein
MKRTVFVVEDDADISRLIKHYLEQAGFLVRISRAPTKSPSRDLAVFVLHTQAATCEPRDLEPDGVRPDVHRREKRHGLRLHKRSLRK